VDVLTKKRVENNGIVPQYYVENSHEAIIPRDLYMQVQEEMLRRVNLHSGAERKKRVYSSKYEGLEPQAMVWKTSLSVVISV
jgi:hypothetical protein